MASRRAGARLTQLWQLPLLVVSLGLFSYAAYLFINPKPGLTIGQRIDVAARLIRHERPEAAVEQLNSLLNLEKLLIGDEARIHLLLAEALEQVIQRTDLPTYRQQLIEQMRLAMAQGIKLTTADYRRLGECYEALGKVAEALDNYRRAMALDPSRGLRLQRKVIALQLAQGESGPAEASLDEYLKDPKLANVERAWALGEKGELLSNRGEAAVAKPLLEDSLRLDGDPVAQGVGHYRLGVLANKAGELADAERLLRVARDQLRVGHPLDAEAACLLGRIRQSKDDPREAISFYQAVLVSHPGSRPAPLALLGRAMSRITLGDDEAGLSDLHDLCAQVVARKSLGVFRPDVIAGLHDAADRLSTKGNCQGALEAMTLEQTLNSDPAAEYYGRLAGLFEKRADEVEKTEAQAGSADRVKREQQVRDLRVRAGESNLAYSRSLTLPDDKGHGEALWRAVGFFDRAGALHQAIVALELFATERPEDGQAPEALLRLGRTYQASGEFDKAIASFQRLQFRYPQSLAAPKAAIPLAQAYIAQGPDSYTKAEKVLLWVVEGNPVVTPEAEEFRQSLFELAQLYFRSARYEEAVSRLEEMSQRYPAEPRMGQILYLMADSYRKSGTLLAARLASAKPTDASTPAIEAEAIAARKDRLRKSRQLFDRVIDQYRRKPGTEDLDRLYLKLSYFYRADCVYDLGEYEEAIKLYDLASLRYQNDPSSLAAYVQIVNAYCALGKMAEARTANERAKWLLQRMPPEAFADGSFSMPREYWSQWLNWTGAVGMWAKK